MDRFLLLYFLVILFFQSTFGDDSLDCNFSKDLCHWTDAYNKHSWILANSSSGINPGHDHTCSRMRQSGTNCNWLSTIPNFTGQQEFALISPRLPNSNRFGCLIFWYNFFVLDKSSTFGVDINSDNTPFNAQPLWLRNVAQSDSWVLGMVNIPPRTSSFYLLFKATLTSTFHDTVGLDDIYYMPGTCPRILDCDFESPIGCEWNTQNAVIVNGTIPDHTTHTTHGHYLETKTQATMGMVYSNMNNLTFGHPSNQHDYCLKFWYNFQIDNKHDTKSFLKVTNSYTSRVSLIKAQDVLDNGMQSQWNEMLYSFSSYSNRTVLMIEMSPDKNSDTLIAIDDIMLVNQECEKIGNCDFESDFCGYLNSDGRAPWIRTTGESGLRKAPKWDTTTGSTDGFYALMPIEYLTRWANSIMASPPLVPSYSSSYKCFTMNYYAVANTTNVTALYVYFLDLTTDNVFDHLVLNATTQKGWSRVHHRLSRVPPRFTVQLLTIYTSRQLQSDLAVDDIAFSSNCQPDATTRPPPYNPHEYLWNTNFEYGQYSYRNWRFDHNWQVTTSREAKHPQAPRRDHTLNRANGHYLLWTPPKISSNLKSLINIATINSTDMSTLSHQTHCFTFWYYDATESMTTLEIYLAVQWSNTRNSTIFLDSIRPNIVTKSWKSARIDLMLIAAMPNTTKFDLQFELKTRSGIDGTFALDDFKLQPGRCNRIDNYLYTFDSWDDLENSHLTPVYSGTGIIYHPTLVYHRLYPSAPRNDHTTGDGNYYLFMNNQNDRNTTYVNRLIVEDIPATQYDIRCVRFAYQIFGNATLNAGYAESDGNTIHMKFHTIANHLQWAVTQFYYSAPYKHRIVFEMGKLYDNNSYVALDDIELRDHKCSEPVDCDFEDDVCSYTSMYHQNDYQFARFTGPPTNQTWPGPAYDHTIRGYGGGYLYMSGYPSQYDMTRQSAIQTPIIIYGDDRYVSGNFCLSFWSVLTDKDATLEISAEFYSQHDLYIDVVLAKLKDQQENSWTQHYIDIDVKYLKKYKEFGLKLIGRTQKAKTLIALDDIQFFYKPCYRQKTFECDDDSKITADKVCDFHIDCIHDGSDEEDCGNADFETSLGGWANVTQLTTNMNPLNRQAYWMRVKALIGHSLRGGPKVDGNNNANGHYLMLYGQNYYQGQFAHLDTPLQEFKHAYYKCQLTFDYYMHINRTYYSSFYIMAGNTMDSNVYKAYIRNNSTTWQKGIVYLGSYSGPFVVKFSGISIPDSVIAFDNIRFDNCAIPEPEGSCTGNASLQCKTTKVCIDPSDLCDFENDCGDNWDENFGNCSPFKAVNVPPSCAFEQTFDYCGFSQDPPPTKNSPTWRLNQGSLGIMIAFKGPGADHTTNDKDGQFAMLDMIPKKHAQLYSPMMTSSASDPCIMRFFYFNNGAGNFTNQLTVRARFADSSRSDSAPLFTSTSYSPRWIKGKAYFRSVSPFQFVFDGVLADADSSISIDDVSFSGECARSKATRGDQNESNGKSHAAVVVVIIFLIVGLAVAGYFGYTRKLGRRLALPSLPTKINLSRSPDKNQIVSEDD